MLWQEDEDRIKRMRREARIDAMLIYGSGLCVLTMFVMLLTTYLFI